MLVQTVGGLLAVTGVALVLVSRRPRVGPEWTFLAAAVPLALALVDVIFASRRVIPPIYLTDSAIEAFFALAWLVVVLGRRAERHRLSFRPEAFR